MKIKPLVLISCLAAGALVASPAVGKPEKKPARKSTSASVSKSTRVVPRATQVTPKYRYKQNPSPRISGTRYDVRSHYSGARSYSGRQHGGTNYYYNGTRQYAANTYYGGTRYYYGGGSYPYYSYYSGWPYSNWGYGTSWGYYPYSYYGGYPYTGHNNYYSYYTPTYGYNVSMVAAVQRRLGQLGYYHGAVDGVIGPRTRGAIAAFESRNGLVVDARISRLLLDRLGLA